MTDQVLSLDNQKKHLIAQIYPKYVKYVFK